ncbi:hypothetical protein LIER_41953 [Lithospermum erythrorhizon]|uniref:F-box domain-containing protein n=1 Tax=Lithospermum erythrorhizon TaxID=34254 RepID=A0AAV3RIR4_LITER
MLILPDDVITDILSRLPVKPLLRFRCVCKPWLDLIDSPVFIKLHLNKTKKLESHRTLIQQGSAPDIYTVDFDSITKTNIAEVISVPDPFGPVGVVNCCNGLVCVSIPNGSGIAIWNPSTRRHQILPDFDCFPLPTRSKGCRSFCGFEYDVLGDDYKVLVIKQTDSVLQKSFSSEVSVYSLKENSWKQIKPFPYYLKYERSPGVAACGAIHCIVGKTKWCSKQLIAAFDLATEEYRIVPQPKYPSKMDFYLYLETLGGCLSLMWGYRIDYIDVWVLKEYGKQDSWTKITRINASTFSGNSFGFMRTIAYSVSEKELIMEKGMNSMVRYDIEKKSAKNVEIRGERTNPIYSHIYQESLVQLKNGGPTVSQKQVAHHSKKIEKPKKRDKFLSHGFKLVL